MLKKSYTDRLFVFPNHDGFYRIWQVLIFLNEFWQLLLNRDARVESSGRTHFAIVHVDRRAIQRANCYHRDGHDAPCSVGGDGYYMFLFGLAQAVLLQIPGFHEMAGLSVFAAVMSFFYSFVGVGLGLAKVIGTCCLAYCSMLSWAFRLPTIDGT